MSASTPTGERWTTSILRRYAAFAARVKLPGSKSISNRILLLAALAAGETHIRDRARFRRHALHARRIAHAGCRRARADGARGDARARRGRRVSGQAGRTFSGQRGHRVPAADGGARVVRRRAIGCRACRACTSGRSAIWSTPCTAWVRRSIIRRDRIIRRCISAPRAARRPAKSSVRGNVSSQYPDCVADGVAADRRGARW